MYIINIETKNYFLTMISLLLKRMKHSNITYNASTRVTLIDNSLIKALEIAKNRKLKLAKISNTTKVIEMSESHDAKPHIKTTNSNPQ